MNCSIFVISLAICAMVYSFPLETPSSPDEIVAVYVPYDIKYVPVEIPDKYLQQTTSLNTKESISSVAVSKEDLLDQLKKQNSEVQLNKDPTVLAAENQASSNKGNIESFVVVPNSVIKQALKIQAVPDSAPLEIKTEHPDVSNLSKTKNFVVLPVNTEASTTEKNLNASKEPIPPKEDNLDVESEESNSKPHSISKRQAPGFVFRPVLRFSRIRTNRRRVQRPNRQNALVGYLNDRDLFPTVA